jgi:hypothetical protein
MFRIMFLTAEFTEKSTLKNCKQNDMGWECSMYGGGERRGTYRILAGKPDGKTPLGRPRHRWEDNDNIKLDLQEVGLERHGLD